MPQEAHGRSLSGLKTLGPGQEGCVRICSSKADMDKRQEQRGRQEIELSVGQHEERSWTHVR